MEGIIRKSIRILIVHREGLNEKWWHRLINIIIYGSTVVFLCFVFYFLSAEAYPNWKKYNYTSYSFKPNYELAEGKEVDCIFISSFMDNNPFISCGDIENSTDFLYPYLNKKSYTLQELDQIMNVDKANQMMNDLIDSGELKNIKTKRTTTILHVQIIKDISIAILFILGWFILFESVLYRALIYIIYGKNR